MTEIEMDSGTAEEIRKGEDQGDHVGIGAESPKIIADEQIVQNEVPAGVSLTEEVQINIESCSKEDEATMGTTGTLSKDSFSKGPSVDFSEEKDAPEVTTRVYDFNMVKLKTLPRNFVGSKACYDFCSSQPKAYYLVWALMGVSIIVCTVVVILFWLIET